MGKGGTEINYPQQPNYSESMRESLQAQIDLAPDLYRAEASQQFGRPAYAQLETDILRDTLLGQQRFTPEGGDPVALRDLDMGVAGGQPMSVAGGKYQTIMRPGSWDESTGQRQFSVDLIDPQSGETVMSQTGAYPQRDPVGGPDAVGADSQAIGGAMQTLFSNAAERGLVTGEQAAQAQQGALEITGDRATYTAPRPATAMDVGTEAEKWAAYVNMHPDLKEAWGREGGDISEWGRGHYEQFGGSENRFLPEIGKTYDTATGQEYVPSVTEGTIGRGDGLLDIMGGTQTQEFAQGDPRRAGFTTDPTTGKQVFAGLAQYGSDVAEQAARSQRTADIFDVEQLGKRATDAMRAADPLATGLLERMGQQATASMAEIDTGQYSGLLGTLQTQAGEDLAAGRGLSPRQRREAEQAARAGWEARGMIRGPEAVVSEVESVMEAAGTEEAKRRAFAQNVLALEAARRGEGRTLAQATMGASQAMTADPFMAILGRPSGASQQIAQGGLGSAQYGLTSGPQQYSPEAGLSFMLGQQTNQANLAAAQAAANATRSAGMASGLGALGGGIAQGIIGL